MRPVHPLHPTGHQGAPRHDGTLIVAVSLAAIAAGLVVAFTAWST